jgi:hypothetical protein
VRIHGLTVCVNYAEFLAASLPRWMPGLASLTIVTTPADHETQALAVRHGANVFETDLFTADGAVFNKGRAMEAARVWAEDMVTHREPGWRLFFDSDVCRRRAGRRGSGCSSRASSTGACATTRRRAPRMTAGRRSARMTCPGSGTSSCSTARIRSFSVTPLLDTHWTHAGNYDNRFMDLWRARRIQVRTVPFRVAHIGERENWFGRGNRAAFDAMKAERAARGGGWQPRADRGVGVITCQEKSTRNTPICQGLVALLGVAWRCMALHGASLAFLAFLVTFDMNCSEKSGVTIGHREPRRADDRLRNIHPFDRVESQGERSQTARRMDVPVVRGNQGAGGSPSFVSAYWRGASERSGRVVLALPSQAPRDTRSGSRQAPPLSGAASVYASLPEARRTELMVQA